MSGGELLPRIANNLTLAVPKGASQQHDCNNKGVQVVYGEKGQGPSQLTGYVEIKGCKKQPEVDQSF